VGFLFGFVVAGLGITWFWNIFGHAAVPLWAIFAAWMGLFFAGRALLVQALPRWWAFAAVVLWWTAVEFFRAECYYLRCTFLCLGHALAAESCPLKSAAAVLGAYGLGMLVFAVNAAAEQTVLCRRPTNRGAVGALSLALAALLAATVWGRLAVRGPASSDAIRVALVQSESPFPAEYARLSRCAAEFDPRFVFWPEISLLGDVKTNAFFRNPVAELAREMNAFIGVGAKLNHATDLDNFWNAYVLFDPAGEVAGEYHKMQPVQFMKDGAPGSEYGLYRTPLGTLGVAICYDADFSWISRETVRRGAEALVVPVYDGEHWGLRMRWQHVQAHVLRAVENGRYVLRPASSGPSMIIAPDGSITARLDDMSIGVVTGRFGLRSALTPYTRLGWNLPRVCQVASLALLVAACVRAWAARVRRPKAPSPATQPDGVASPV